MSNEQDLAVKHIKGFVNLMIEAHEAGFVDKNNPTLAEIHRVAQNHLQDQYGVKTKDIVEEWGVETAVSCGMKEETAVMLAATLKLDR